MTLKTKKYSSILATATHQQITDLSAFRAKWAQPTMGFFLKGEDIGYGDLTRGGLKKGFLHTESVALRRGFRNKGHGIHLYVHLIETARKLGAKRIYSSTNLNKFSRRMWKEKLGTIYTVVTVKSRSKCRRCDCYSKKERYYIELGD